MKYPIITLSNVSLKFDSQPLFDNINLSILKGDRVCLIGRNGSGKSSLLKIIAGSLKPELGNRFLKPGSSVAFLSQSHDFSNFLNLGEYIFRGLTKVDYLKQKSKLAGLSVDFNKSPINASGGELRRASLIRALICPSDLLLLDEPTNHLDIGAIESLERYLLNTHKAFVIISHDRIFLEKLGDKLLWIDRGSAQTISKNFCDFEDWRDKSYAIEVLNAHKLSNKIKTESLWAVEGISARRKRNQRRLKELQALKDKKKEIASLPILPKFKFSKSDKSAKLVIEAKNISKMFDGKEIIRQFSFLVNRGDRVAIVGENGVGKTTLINLLLKKEEPDSGNVRLGISLNIAMLDQNKESLPIEMSLWNFLSGFDELGASGKNDQIMVQNQPRHIVGYLNDFLFTREQVYGKIRDLSGGEKSRLLLAVLMAKPSNLLVLDEPTNDLDLETLDLLKELISLYHGTVIFVSHDRDFIDSVASYTLFLEEKKPIVIHSGGVSDFVRSNPKTTDQKQNLVRSNNLNIAQNTLSSSDGMTKTLESKLVNIEEKMGKLEAEIKKLEIFLSDQNLYIQNQRKFERASEELISRQDRLRALEEEWLKCGALLSND